MKTITLFLVGFCLASAAYSYPDPFNTVFNLALAGLNYWSYRRLN